MIPAHLKVYNSALICSSSQCKLHADVWFSCTVPMLDTKDHVDRISSIALLFASLANNVHSHLLR